MISKRCPFGRDGVVGRCGRERRHHSSRSARRCTRAWDAWPRKQVKTLVSNYRKVLVCFVLFVSAGSAGLQAQIAVREAALQPRPVSPPTLSAPTAEVALPPRVGVTDQMSIALDTAI